MTLLIYIIKTIFISGALLGYYWFFLRNRRFHGFNRFFLLSISILSFLLPLLQLSLPVWRKEVSGSSIPILGVGRGTLEEAVTVYASRGHGSTFSWELLMGVTSLLVMSFLIFRFFKTLRFLIQLSKDKPFLKLSDATIYFVSEKGTPFSFFKSIFWERETAIGSPGSRLILRHELFHVQKKHSLDMLALEIISILYWFNPFIHYIRRELQVIHEYSADEFASAGTDSIEYASLLLRKISGPRIQLAHPFFKNQIKRRIHMVTKTNKNKKAWLGQIMIVPLVGLLLVLFSFKSHNLTHPAANKVLRVVIDPGHGGNYPGVSFNNVQEKNINLSISKKIQQLAKQYQVEVIMTRENDNELGTGDLKSDLRYRAALPAKTHADLFISIHANGTSDHHFQDKYSGFEIYIPDNESKYYDESVKLGSMISNNIKDDYAIVSDLKQRQTGISILMHATVPAILIECGFLDNPSDIKYLLDEHNQEKIARDILKGIQQYGHANASYLVAPLSSITVSGAAVPAIKAENDKPSEVHNDSTAPYKKVELEAEFPGGNAAWAQYLFKNLNYPLAAEKDEIQGEVVVEFVVKTNGHLSDIRAISGPVSLRSESVRVIRESGKWAPAEDHGKKVASYRKQPIIYHLK